MPERFDSRTSTAVVDPPVTPADRLAERVTDLRARFTTIADHVEHRRHELEHAGHLTPDVAHALDDVHGLLVAAARDEPVLPIYSTEERP